MEVMHLSAECYPVAKAGGLGDVVGALPKFQCRAGVDASVVMPFYDRPFVRNNEFEPVFRSSYHIGVRQFEFTILKEKTNKLGFALYLIHIEGLLDRPEIYSYPDELEQFISFQLAFRAWIAERDKKPDLIHCHDHHAGLVPFLISHSPDFTELKNIPTVTTVHNGQYQGWLSWDKISYLGSIDLTKAGLLDWSNCINSLAASIKCCWRFTTVSPSYLIELTERSNGLEQLFQMERSKGQGIINGIDEEVWDPRRDQYLIRNYSSQDVTTGKRINKRNLCKTFQQQADLPLIIFIGRLVGEKGADLLPELISTCLETFPGEFNFILLGSGDKNIENELSAVSERYKKHFGLQIGYDEELSHRMYSGADFLLMPSRVEPCGLNQLYALKYGTMPIVSSTGGLKDTIIDVSEADGYGIRFDALSISEIVKAVGRALSLYSSDKVYKNYQKRMMALDFSCDRSASDYIKLYKSLLNS